MAPAPLQTGEIAIVSCSEHVTGHKRQLRAHGIEPILLGADPLTVPQNVRVLVGRIEGSAHRGIATAQTWQRADPDNRLFLYAKGGTLMMRQLREHGLLPGDDDDDDADDDAEEREPQREDYSHDGAFFAALLAQEEGALSATQAKAICTKQGASFHAPAFALARRVWRAAQGLPPLAPPVSGAPNADAGAADAGAAARPSLNELAPEGRGVGAWVGAIIEADPNVTARHVEQLARLHGVIVGVQKPFSVRQRRWREAAGLEPLPPSKYARPVCWTPAMGNDSEAWPQPHMRPVPTVEELRVEIQLWEEEAERLRGRVDTQLRELQDAQAAAHVAGTAQVALGAAQTVEAAAKAAEAAALTAWTTAQEELEAVQATLAATQGQLADARLALTQAQQGWAITLAEAVERERVERLAECEQLRRSAKDAKVLAAQNEATLAAALDKARATIAVREDAIAAAQTQIAQLEVSQSPDVAVLAEAQQLQREVQQLKLKLQRATEEMRRIEEHGEELQAANNRLRVANDAATAAAATAAAAAPATATAPTLDEVLAAVKKAHNLLAVLGPDTPWDKLEAVLRITL